MANEVLVKYKLDVDDLTQKLNVVIEKQDEISQSTKENDKDIQKNINDQKSAAQKRIELLQKEQQVLKQLKADRAKAFDPDQIKKLDVAISKAQSNIAQLGGGFQKAKGIISEAISGIGLELAAAFSVGAIIAFSKSATDAFLEAEQNASKLEFAVTKINGDSQSGFQRLIEQSEKLQKTTIFSDDSIQQAQTALATFGLTANQIEKLLPILADYASAQKISIVEASNQVTAGLEGQGREFKRLGIEISATQTPLENLSKIQEGLSKFTGAAAEATKTYAGQLEVAKNRADDLEETLGSKLAPIFVKLKTALLEATLGIFGFNKAQEEAGQTKQNSIEKNFEQAAEKIKKSGGDIQKSFQDRADAIKAINSKLADEVKKADDVFNGKSNVRLSTEQYDALAKQKAVNEDLIKQNETKLKIIQNILDREKEQTEQDDRTLSREQLKVKSLGELNKLLIENKKFSDSIANSNIQLINEELEARKKLADRRVADASLIEKIESRSAAATILNINDVEKAFLTLNKAKITDNVDLEKFIQSVQKSSIENQKTEEEDFTKFLEDQNKKRVDSTKTTADQTNVIYTSLVDSIIGTWVRKNQEQLQLEGQLVAELTTLFDGFFNQQISQITDLKNTQLDSISTQEADLKKSLENRYISQKEFDDAEKELIKKKAEAEAEADKKIRKLKKEQAILDKANALFQIAINTAIAATRPDVITNPVLEALVLALGAAQAATVIATPIPAYRKGSKNTGKSGMALVGEDGPEAVFMPGGSKVLNAQKTKHYSELIDAMYDGRLESHILNKYMAPALMKQKREFEALQQNTFAQNITNSISLNKGQMSISSSDLERVNSRGIKITNPNELGRAIAEHLISDPRRR